MMDAIQLLFDQLGEILPLCPAKVRIRETGRMARMAWKGGDTHVIL